MLATPAVSPLLHPQPQGVCHHHHPFHPSARVANLCLSLCHPGPPFSQVYSELLTQLEAAPEALLSSLEGTLDDLAAALEPQGAEDLLATLEARAEQEAGAGAAQGG